MIFIPLSLNPVVDINFKVNTNAPLSGPGILKAVRKRGQKRKINEALSMQEGDEESWENDYRGRLLKF